MEEYATFAATELYLGHCNDESAAIRPNATEVCNFVDDDCNGILDDPAGCPRCMGPETMGGSATPYYFCFEPLSSVDCVGTTPEGWMDIPCAAEPQPFICQGP